MDIVHKAVVSHVTQEKIHLTKTIKHPTNASVLCMFKEKKKSYTGYFREPWHIYRKYAR